MQRRKSSSAAKKSSAEPSQDDAERQLESFLGKYDPDVATFAGRALAKMRKVVPGAVEMVYDNYNWLVVGFAYGASVGGDLLSRAASGARDALLSAGSRTARP
jgi:hypothetical protein